MLTSAIWSCRSSKQSEFDYSDTTSVVASASVSKLSNSEITALLSASKETDFNGIKIEFYPPDSAHPDARAAPKLLTIENASAKQTADLQEHKASAVDELKDLDIKAQNSAAFQQTSKSETDIIYSAAEVTCFSILAAMLIVIISLIILIKTK